jgi:hypothetical protein
MIRGQSLFILLILFLLISVGGLGWAADWDDRWVRTKPDGTWIVEFTRQVILRLLTIIFAMGLCQLVWLICTMVLPFRVPVWRAQEVLNRIF